MSDRNDLARPFNTSYFKEYYSGYRDKIEDLFPSETYFLNSLVERSETILDVGCANGGMFEIINSINKEVQYCGVDIAAELIDIAKKKYPKVDFRKEDGISLSFEDNSFDSVVSFGTTVHDQDYKNLITECYRISRRGLLFDMRLVPSLPSLNDISKGYVIDDSGPKYAYNIANATEFLTFLKGLNPRPAKISIYGYWGSANEFTHLPQGYEKLCMCGIFLEKDIESTQTTIGIEVPFEF